ncbi:unnamed protein product [Linum trigynum]|uniref:Uncharacterized protein n=1 Tax=Linum trigynum TaxID=586398 RepID=A0AAV2D730_9ROSI
MTTFFKVCDWSRRWQGVVDMMGWAAKIMKERPQSEVESWALLLWALWNERNAQLFNKKKWSESKIVTCAQALLEEY